MIRVNINTVADGGEDADDAITTARH